MAKNQPKIKAEPKKPAAEKPSVPANTSTPTTADQAPQPQEPETEENPGPLSGSMEPKPQEPEVIQENPPSAEQTPHQEPGTLDYLQEMDPMEQKPETEDEVQRAERIREKARKQVENMKMESEANEQKDTEAFLEERRAELAEKA